MGRHVKPQESAIICRVYEKHIGDWSAMMADPEIVNLGYERHTLQHHLAYKKRTRNKPRHRVLRRLMVERPGSASSSQEEEEDEHEEFECVAITARKLGNPTKWYAVFKDGDERWLPESCFIDIDGTVNELFTRFEDDHPDANDVTYSKKRVPVKSEEEELHEPKRKKTESSLLAEIKEKLAVIEREQKEIVRLISLIPK